MPKNSDSGTAITAAVKAKNSVLLNLGATKSTTVRDRSIPDAFLPENDVPKSPVSTPPTQSKYLISMGLSKPNSFLNAATVSYLAD